MLAVGAKDFHARLGSLAPGHEILMNGDSVPGEHTRN
jgi:hypothetical protein